MNHYDSLNAINARLNALVLAGDAEWEGKESMHDSPKYAIGQYRFAAEQYDLGGDDLAAARCTRQADQIEALMEDGH